MTSAATFLWRHSLAVMIASAYSIARDQTLVAFRHEQGEHDAGYGAAAPRARNEAE